jgi:thiamine biosynthesis lipoprotein
MLGTLVAVRVCELPEPEAHRAINAAFAEIAATEQTMSFHHPDSDVSRLNRAAYREPVQVNPHTLLVLRLAQYFAEATHGIFDITTAAQLVAWGLLPRPDSPSSPDPRASWRDVLFGPNREVSFARPLWIDLGGIAKGYAVDRAVVCLGRHGVRHCCVNAGGDLRVVGIGLQRVGLRTGEAPAAFAGAVDLENGSLASSGRCTADAGPASHVDGVTRRAAGTGAFACVVAESCAVADALTKPVLSLGPRCAEVLRRFGATAHMLDAGGTWRHFGAAA